MSILLRLLLGIHAQRRGVCFAPERDQYRKETLAQSLRSLGDCGNLGL